MLGSFGMNNAVEWGCYDGSLSPLEHLATLLNWSILLLLFAIVLWLLDSWACSASILHSYASERSCSLRLVYGTPSLSQ